MPHPWVGHIQDRNKVGSDLARGFNDIAGNALLAHALLSKRCIYTHMLEGDMWTPEVVGSADGAHARALAVIKKFSTALAAFSFHPLSSTRSTEKSPALSTVFAGPFGGVTLSGSPRHGGRCYITVNDPQVCDAIIAALEPFFADAPRPEPEPLHKRGAVHMLTRDRFGNIDIRRVGVAGVDLERDNYADDVLALYDHVLSDMTTPTPCGRLALFHGVPGSGKTYLIRAMLKLVKHAGFVVVPPTMVEALGDPAIIPALADGAMSMPNNRMVFLVEDADEALVPRHQAVEQHRSNVKALSSLLNMSDGIPGAMFDIRIVATTNAALENIDAAVIRDGRLCRQVHVGKLAPTKANQIYRRLLPHLPDAAFSSAGGPFNEPVALATVYRKARDAGWAPVPITASVVKSWVAPWIHADRTRPEDGRPAPYGVDFNLGPEGPPPPARETPGPRAPEPNFTGPLVDDPLVEHQQQRASIEEYVTAFMDAEPQAQHVVFGPSPRAAEFEDKINHALHTAPMVLAEFPSGWPGFVVRALLAPLGARFVQGDAGRLLAVVPGQRAADGPQQLLMPDYANPLRNPKPGPNDDPATYDQLVTRQDQTGFPREPPPRDPNQIQPGVTHIGLGDDLGGLSQVPQKPPTGQEPWDSPGVSHPWNERHEVDLNLPRFRQVEDLPEMPDHLEDVPRGVGP